MIARLRTPIGAYAAEETPDGRGGFSTHWVFFTKLWAHIDARSGRETDNNGRRVVSQDYTVIIHYRDDLPERLRLMWGDRILRVITMSDPDNRRERLHLICEEEQQ